MSGSDRESGTVFATDRVSINYGPKTVVEDLWLSIPRHALTVLVGPNGSGKSTLLKALAGAISPEKGSILLDGKALSSMSPKQIAKNIAMLAQGPSAPEGLSVGDLVRQGRYPHRGLFSRWSDVDAAACAKALELTGLVEMAERPLDSLSGGQKQRAWIALTLAQQTDVLLLDEPTTFLDIAHQFDILNLLKSLVTGQGATVVAVLHDINQAARYADHLIFMKNGQVVARGNAADTATPDVIEGVFGVPASIITNPLDGTPLILLDGVGEKPSAQA